MEEEIGKRTQSKPILRFVDSEVSGIHPDYPGSPQFLQSESY